MLADWCSFICHVFLHMNVWDSAHYNLHWGYYSHRMLIRNGLEIFDQAENGLFKDGV